MKLSQFSPALTHFFVPAFTIFVGGRDLVGELYLTVTKVEVDLKERAAGRFSCVVASGFDWTQRDFVAMRGEERIDLLELFAFGAPVTIAIGYGSRAELEPMLEGVVTEIGTSFGEGGTPELAISGYDGLYPLTIGKNTRHWEGVRDSDAVREVLGDYPLDATIIDTGPEKPRIDQEQETDFAFLEKMAERNGATFYVRAGKVYFGPRQNDLTGAVEATWGEDLSSFAPTANIAKQITEVEVHGFDAVRGEPIVGRARRGDEGGRDGARESGGEHTAAALGKSPVVRIRAPVHTQAEADERAKAILEERAQDFVTGDGECIGIPDILPDTNVTLTGLGRAFSKTYYVSGVVHTLDSGGFKTRFSVREPRV